MFEARRSMFEARRSMYEKRLKVRGIAIANSEIPDASGLLVLTSWHTEALCTQVVLNLEQIGTKLIHVDRFAGLLQFRLHAERCHLRFELLLGVLVRFVVDAVEISPELGTQLMVRHWIVKSEEDERARACVVGRSLESKRERRETDQNTKLRQASQ